MLALTMQPRWFIPMLAVLACGATSLCCAAPPTADQVRELLKEPPTLQNWLVWRDYYTRLCYAYDAGEPVEFYERLGAFVSGAARANDGELPELLQDDPIAWVVWSRDVWRTSPDNVDRMVELARKGHEAGDPQAIASNNLAVSLLTAVGLRRTEKTLTPEEENQLAEAEQLFDAVERTVPHARLSYYRGLIHLFRGDVTAALPHLRQGALDQKVSPEPAVQYLAALLASTDKEAKRPGNSEHSAPLAEQFPNSAAVLALHAAALYRDERYPEALEAWNKSKAAGPEGEKFLGAEGIQWIEEGRWITPAVIEGRERYETHVYDSAAMSFRRALREDPENVLAAKWLANSLLKHATTHPVQDRSRLVDECAGLCQQFPKEGELHTAHAAALHLSQRSIEAVDALHRAEALDFKPNSVLGMGATETIEQAARQQRRERWGWAALIGGLSAFGGWLLIMFGMGAVLAVCTPRTPSPVVVAGDAISPGEVWLEGFTWWCSA